MDEKLEVMSATSHAPHMTPCYLCPRKDAVGLIDIGGTTPDLRPACDRHHSPTISVEALLADLTEAQRRVVELSVDHSSTHSGRGGHNVQIMRALERKGLVKQGKVHTWETNWRFTPAGVFIGARLHRASLEKICREKSTPELKTWFPDARGQQCQVIMQELETRGWQWQSTSADWVRIHASEWAIVEGIAGTYSYHVRDTSLRNANSLTATCDARVMTTKLPLSAWGTKDHLPSRWCRTCAARAELPPTTK